MNLLSMFFLSLFISLTPAFFTPSRVYFTNYKEFSFLFHEILPYLILTSLSLFLLIFLFLNILNRLKNKKIFRVANSLIFIFGFLFWFQSNMLVWDYGLFNGEPIQWELYSYRNYVDAIIWISLTIFGFYKFDLINRISAKLGIFFIVFQTIYIVILGLQLPSTVNIKNYDIDKSDKYIFSKNRNVIAILLDATQTDLFSEVLSENPDLLEVFDGFNYFPDTLSSYSATDFSVPSMFSGIEYKNDSKQQTYWERSMGQSKLLKTLKDNKYINEIYTDELPLMYLYSHPNVNNVKTKKYSLFNKSLVEKTFYIFDISLFNSTPSGLKEMIYNNQKWRLRRLYSNFAGLNKSSRSSHEEMMSFFNEFDNKAVFDEDQSIFKYYHVSGAHPPFILKSDMTVGEPGTGIVSYKEQLIAVFKGVSIFFKTLQLKGIYDKSFIVIFGDHGVGLSNKPTTISIQHNDSLKVSNVSSSTMKMALPLLLIKPFNSRGELKKINVQSSLIDIPKTIISNIGIDSTGFPGIDLLDSIDSTQNRMRTHYSFNWNKVDVGKDYPPYLNEYLIKGDSWLSESWSPLLSRHYPTGKKIKIDRHYAYGDKILFSQDGNIYKYKLGGWSKTDPGSSSTWTIEEVASLKLSLNEIPKSDLVMRVKALSLYKHKVSVYINNKNIGEFVATNSSKEYRILIPEDSFETNDATISFYMPEAVKTPKDLGLGNDTRKLGLAFEYLTIDQE